MPRLSLVLVAGVVGLLIAARAEAQVEEGAGPFDFVLAHARTALRANGTPAPLTVARAGVTAEEIAAMPRLEPRARTAMRAACEAGAASCDRLALLGRLERAALIRALRARGLVVDAAPAGKRIGRIFVVTLPPFGKEVAWLEWANFLHVDTKPGVIAREVLARPGDPWTQEVIEESQRKLRDPLFATVAVIVPVRPATTTEGGPGDDAVDLLVVNRDIFSLRLNSNYEVQQGQITYLALSLSENNFLGRRLDFRFRGGPIFDRATGDLEGSDAAITLTRPLWSLQSDWSWRVDASHGDTVERSFRGTALRTFDADVTPEDDLVPWRYRLRRWSVGGGVTRAWGDRYEQRLTLGYDLTSRRPSVQDDVVAGEPDPAVLAEFTREVLPRSERAGVTSVSYEVFTPRYREYVDIDLFDLAEDVRLGPRLEVGLGAGLGVLGSENRFGRASIEGGWTVPWGGDGLASLAGSFATRLAGGAAIDRTAAATLRVVSPATRVGRVVGEVRLAGLFREQGNRFFTIGGDSGLRGFPVGAFAGQRRAVAQVEGRTRSIRFLFGIRWGAIAFYDVGHAADTLSQLALQHDVGLGIRSLTPQLSRDVFRFDLAVPLTGPDRGAPRLILGYRQAF